MNLTEHQKSRYAYELDHHATRMHVELSYSNSKDTDDTLPYQMRYLLSQLSYIQRFIGYFIK
jgi:hypothetical protein